MTNRITQHDIDAALARADEVWSNDTTHVDNEQAHLDRLWLAAEVKKLRKEAADHERELHAAYAEIQALVDERPRLG